MAEYEAVIGLEVHVQLKTESKVFCGCPTAFGAPPNSSVCPVCLGLPGTLPVLNEKALRYAVLTGMMLGSRIAPFSKFDRKNYFYPDLPKNYQISQYDLPLCVGGGLEIEVEGARKRIGITRVHLEEDAGKLVHSETPGGDSGVDFNRTGVPLLEIVSEPAIASPDEAYAYLKALKLTIQYLGVSDCDMEKGSLRCDANVSIRPRGARELGVKAEVKNMNSFRAVHKALAYEIERQKRAVAAGERIVQETRLWEADSEMTHPMRSKEEAHDYRYFPEPDLVPVVPDEAWLRALRGEIPEAPLARRDRFAASYGLTAYDADVLTSERELADYFEAVVKAGADPKAAAHLIMGEMLRKLKESGGTILKATTPSRVYFTGVPAPAGDGRDYISPVPIIEYNVPPPAGVAKFLDLQAKGKITAASGKVVFAKMFVTHASPDEIVTQMDLTQISDGSVLAPIVDKVIDANPKSCADYRAGKEKALGFLMGQVMKETKGKGNPQVVTELLKAKIP